MRPGWILITTVTVDKSPTNSRKLNSFISKNLVNKQPYNLFKGFVCIRNVKMHLVMLLLRLGIPRKHVSALKSIAWNVNGSIKIDQIIWFWKRMHNIKLFFLIKSVTSVFDWVDTINCNFDDYKWKTDSVIFNQLIKTGFNQNGRFRISQNREGYLHVATHIIVGTTLVCSFTLSSLFLMLTFYAHFFKLIIFQGSSSGPNGAYLFR
jgi:hypothetical protein